MRTTHYTEVGGEIRIKEIVTPEGVALRFGVVRAGDRVAAFLADALLMGLALFLGILVFGMGTAVLGGFGLVLLMLWVFGLRVFWFPFFEIRWHGSTPGKRWLGLRVVDRHGGVLSSEAIFARNLMREVEIFIPLTALLAPQAIWSNAPGWAALVASAWLIVFALMPLFNRDRLRVGDLVAGTMVVYAPRATLLSDLSRGGGKQPIERFTFTASQLDHYGIHELQVLEDVLRDRATNRETLELVCQKIKKKIGWPRADRDVPDEDFLRDFYDAQRARLEGRLLMGERRERKTASRKRPPKPKGGGGRRR